MKALDSLSDVLPRTGPNQEAINLLSVHISDARKAMNAFEAKARRGVTIFWLAAAALLIVWISAITILGPEKASWPLVLPSNLRSTFLYIGVAISPTATTAQYFDTFCQRFLFQIPSQIAYTVAIFRPSIYKTKTYTVSTALLSVLLLAIVVLLPELTNHYRKRRFGALNKEQIYRLTDAKLNPITDIQAILDKITSIVENHPLGNATNDQATKLRSALTALIQSTSRITSPKGSHPKKNPHKAKKFPIIVLAILMVIAHMSYVANKPSVLVSNLIWATYFLYCLIKSALDPAHMFRDTAQLFGSIGTGAIIQLATVVAPLRFGGPDLFNHTAALATSLACTCFCYIAIAHHIAPKGLWLFERLAAIASLTRTFLTLAYSALSSTNPGTDCIDGRALRFWLMVNVIYMQQPQPNHRTSPA